MGKEEILNSIAGMRVQEGHRDFSAIQWYNYWAQKSKTVVEGPDTAVWALRSIEGLLEIDRDFLTDFLTGS